MTHARTAALSALFTLAVAGAFALGQQAQAAEGAATCEILNWKPMKPAVSMAEFQQLVGAHSSQSQVQIMPLTSQGATTGFMICSW